MPLFYNRIQRRNPQDPAAPQKWYLILRRLGMITEKEVAKDLADETTLNPKEAEMAIHQLFKVIIRYLLNGNTLQLGGLGTFKLTVSCEGADTKEEATPAKVRKINIRFIPSKSFREAIDKALYVEAKKLSEKKNDVAH